MPIWGPSLLLGRLCLLDGLAGGEHLELLEGDLVLVLEVPLDEVLELAGLELETTPLDQLLEVIRVYRLRLLVLDSVEQSVQEHIVLLLVGELVVGLDLEGLHEVAELVLVEVLLVGRVRRHYVLQRGQEPLLGLLVVLRIHRPLQQIHHEVSCLVDWNNIISLEMEEESPEDVSVGDAIVEQWIDIIVLKSLLLELLVALAGLLVDDWCLLLVLVFFFFALHFYQYYNLILNK